MTNDHRDIISKKLKHARISIKISWGFFFLNFIFVCLTSYLGMVNPAVFFCVFAFLYALIIKAQEYIIGVYEKALEEDKK